MKFNYVPTIIGGTLLTPPLAQATGGFVTCLGKPFIESKITMPCRPFS